MKLSDELKKMAQMAKAGRTPTIEEAGAGLLGANIQEVGGTGMAKPTLPSPMSLTEGQAMQQLSQRGVRTYEGADGSFTGTRGLTPSDVSIDFSGLPSTNEVMSQGTGLSPEGFGRLSPTAQQAMQPTPTLSTGGVTAVPSPLAWSTQNVDGGSVSMPNAPIAPQASAPMGQDATRARLQEIFKTDQPVTLNQAMTGNANAVMGTDAQGRIRSFESAGAREQSLADSAKSFQDASLARSRAAGGTGSYEGDSEARQARATAQAANMGEPQRVGGGLGDFQSQARSEGYKGGGVVTRAKQLKQESDRMNQEATLGAQLQQERIKTAQESRVRDEEMSQAQLENVKARTGEIQTRINARLTTGGSEPVSSSEMQNFVELMDEYKVSYNEETGKWRTTKGKNRDLTPDDPIYKQLVATKAGSALLSQPELMSDAPLAFESPEQAEAANLPAGTEITIGGRRAIIE